MMNEVKRIYANAKQMRVINTRKKTVAFVGGRGSGKSTVGGDRSYQCISTMPRSRGFIASATDDTLKRYSLPSMIERWSMLGLEEKEDYLIGIRPKSWFDLPFQIPASYKNVITFSNGSIIDLISLYNPDPGRGGNFQWGIIDEAAICDSEKINKSLMPAMRGPVYRGARIEVEHDFKAPYGVVTAVGTKFFWEFKFADNPLYMSVLYLTSMPWTKKGQYILDMEHDPDVEWIESTWRDNIHVLGPDYGELLRKRLTEVEYAVEVENRRLTRLPNGFYPNFDEDKHVSMATHYAHNRKLEISFDFNAGFNSMLIAQPTPNLAYIHDTLYVKGNQTVDDLVSLFLLRYAGHSVKEVDIYGDRNGNNRSADSKFTIYERIEARLKQAGWSTFRPVKGLDAGHKDKHEMMNVFMQGEKPWPKLAIYAVNCKALITSIMMAPITPGYKKDKSSERNLKHTDRREEATDLSDVFDNWAFFRYKNLYVPNAMDMMEFGIG